MSSATELVNAAIRKVGGQRITSLSDTLPSADVANDVYEIERDALLQSHIWNFAVTRAELNRLSSITPAFGFNYAYTKPADCLRIVSVHDNDAGTGGMVYKSESIQNADSDWIEAIMADPERIWLRYVRKVETVDLMTPCFREVLILRLAKVFATTSANSNTLFGVLDDQMKDAVRRARSIDGMEDFVDQWPEGSWAASRDGGFGQRDGGWPW